MNRDLLLSAGLLSAVLLPEPLKAAAGWTSHANIAELTSTTQFRYYVTLKSPDNPSGCRNKTVFYQDHGFSGSEQMFRILLEAVATGRRVRLYVTGNCDINGYSEISSVSIIPD